VYCHSAYARIVQTEIPATRSGYASLTIRSHECQALRKTESILSIVTRVVKGAAAFFW
jgi:hypothetical protein